LNPKLQAASIRPNPDSLIRRPRDPESQSVKPKGPVRTAGPAPPRFADLAMLASGVHKFGVFSFNIYSFSGYANDLSLHLLGGKAYLSWIFGTILPISFLASGSATRGLQTKVGKSWLAIMLLLLVSVPFSIWKSESLGLLETYIPRVLFLFFYICAFAIDLKLCKTLIWGGVLCNTAVLVSAALFGGADETLRFAIPGSLFLGGANDLALALVSGLGFTLFLTVQKSIFAQILGSVEFLVTLFFMLKTGSRGGFIALGALVITWTIFSPRRGRLFALVLPAVALVPFLPGTTLSRLVSIGLPGSGISSAGMTEAQASQAERTMLLEKSIVYAFTHPVLGLGPGTFIDQLFYDDISNRTHTHALGTHNTYTQLASECGMPVLFLYIGIVVMSIKTVFRIVKKTRGSPQATPVFNMALAILCNTVAFAVASGFHHVAYSQTMPVLSAMSVCLGLASREGDLKWIFSETAAGNV
jgi:hypothetical protein